MLTAYNTDKIEEVKRLFNEERGTRSLCSRCWDQNVKSEPNVSLFDRFQWALLNIDLVHPNVSLAAGIEQIVPQRTAITDTTHPRIQPTPAGDDVFVMFNESFTVSAENRWEVPTDGAMSEADEKQEISDSERTDISMHPDREEMMDKGQRLCRNQVLITGSGSSCSITKSSFEDLKQVYSACDTMNNVDNDECNMCNEKFCALPSCMAKRVGHTGTRCNNILANDKRCMYWSCPDHQHPSGVCYRCLMTHGTAVSEIVSHESATATCAGCKQTKQKLQAKDGFRGMTKCGNGIFKTPCGGSNYVCKGECAQVVNLRYEIGMEDYPVEVCPSCADMIRKEMNDFENNPTTFEKQDNFSTMCAMLKEIVARGAKIPRRQWPLSICMIIIARVYVAALT